MKPDNTQNKKHSAIGVIATSFHSDFSRMVVSQICKRFEKEDVEIHMFLGMDAQRYLPGYQNEEDGLDRHYYSLFGYTAFDDIDVLVISGEAIYTESMIPDMDLILSKLPKVPTIIFSSNEGEGAIHINVDNYNGMKQMISHLYEDHGKRRIAFVSGTPYIPDSAERLRAYKDSVSELGLDDDPDLVVYGNFSTHCDDVIEPLLKLDPLPEAIVCANDEMAVSAYNVIRSYGLRVGEDIAVTGFDDIQVAQAMDPPLTTVRQRFEDVAEKVAQITHDVLEGKRPGDQVIPVSMIYRSSCGCKMQDKSDDRQVEPGFEAHGSYLLSEYENLKNTRRKEMEAVLLLRSLLMQPVTMKGFFEKLGEKLRQIGVKRSFIALCDEPALVPADEKMFVPDHIRLMMVLGKDVLLTWDMDSAYTMTQDRSIEASMVRNSIPRVRGGIWCTFLLFYGNVQYGTWSVQLELSDMLFYYDISLNIGSALRYLYLALDQQETHRQLEERNQILDFSASHDDLTGLYNRAGIMQFCYRYIQDHSRQDYFVAVIADLDHLKQINDNFGHGEGDYAIKKAGEILSEVFPSDARVGRSGGDEFIGVFASSRTCNEYNFAEKVRKACVKENETNLKPYYVEISVGCHTFYKDSVAEGLIDLFKKADSKLYLTKKKRRESVVKEM